MDPFAPKFYFPIEYNIGDDLNFVTCKHSFANKMKLMKNDLLKFLLLLKVQLMWFSAKWIGKEGKKSVAKMECG